MDTTKYISILNENILNDNRYILFDNDPKHKSNKSMNFLSKNKIKFIDFPPYSPDLNPIENIFSILKQNIQKHKKDITRQNFDKIIIEEWNKQNKYTDA